MTTPEVLAPAGNKDAFFAALGAGADAIYVGLDSFNARRGAKNFNLKTLKQCTKRAHRMGVKVYVTVNILILPHEMEEALELAVDAWNAGVDALIVQDIGLLRELARRFPDIRIHASTQINTQDSQTVRALADLGVSRVTLARELSLAEIATLVAVGHEAGIEIEVFAHGALCMSYSGQCLFSSLVGRRSANRGLCAQPCRLPYELIDHKNEVLAEVGPHLLSPKDLCSIEKLAELVAAGVDSFKIEGRMKSPGYVATVVANYKQALCDLAHAEGLSESPETQTDSAQVPDPSPASDGDLQQVVPRADTRIPELSAAYNRGLTQAYLMGKRGNEMMSYTQGAGVERAADISSFADECIARAQAIDISELVVTKRLHFESDPLRKRKVKFGQQSIDVVAVVATMGAARAALNADANEAHINAIELLDQEPIHQLVPVLPRVCHDHELEELIGIAYRFEGAVASTLGQLRLCRERGIPVQAHWSLNVTNAYACEELAQMGATRVWLSPELSEQQIASIARRSSVPLGIGIIGLAEVMVTEHCILMAQGSCNQRCAECKKRTQPKAVRDEKGYAFPVRTDPSGRSHIYNSVPLDLTAQLPEILMTGVEAIRLDLETALTDFVPQEVARIRHALIDVYAGRETPLARDSTTKGHFFRGVV